MITYDPKTWFKFIFKFHKSDSFRTLIPALIGLILITSALVFVEVNYLKVQVKNITFFHQVIGFVLSMLLVFRINTAYDRWWEGRKMWGELLNLSRTLSFQINTFLPETEKEIRKKYGTLISNFALSLKEHLRENKTTEGIDFFDDFKKAEYENENQNHKPLFIINKLFVFTNDLYIKNQLSSEQFLLINNQLNRHVEITGACERIKSTPIPYSYSLYLKRIIFVYVITMPFVFAIDFKYWAVLFVALIFYSFASLELLSEEIEDPFGTDANDLPTDEIALKIKQNSNLILNQSI
jgi:putative membrane protein